MQSGFVFYICRNILLPRLQFYSFSSFERGIVLVRRFSQPYSLFTASQFLNILCNVLLSNFKAERFVHRFQPFLLGFYIGFDLNDHCCEFFFTFLSRFGIDIMRFPLTISVSRTVSALVEVVVYHCHTARAGFATFGLVRLEIGRGGIYPYSLIALRNWGFCAANLAVYFRRRLPSAWCWLYDCIYQSW